MDEINHFLQSVHSDFEQFLKKNMKDQNETNIKILKLSDVAHKTLDNLE